MNSFSVYIREHSSNCKATCMHAHTLEPTSSGKLLWGLTDCHPFDGLSCISPEQQWGSYAESIICSQPIYRETAITFYHG